MRNVVIMEITVERSVKEQIIMFPIPLATYHIRHAYVHSSALGDCY